MKQLNLVVEHFQQHIKTFSSFFKENFNTNLVINSLIIAIFLSVPIYLYGLSENIFIKIINFILISIGFYLFFNKKFSFFYLGFFIGIFWFYWIALSFRYYNLTWMIPIIILAIGIGYGAIFWLINKIIHLITFLLQFLFKDFIKYIKNYYLITSILWALTIIFIFDYIKPFNFDWLKPEVLIATTFLKPTKLILAFFILIFILLKIDTPKKLPIYLVILLSLNMSYSNHIKMPNLKINLITTHIPQEKKWDKKYLIKEISDNFKYILDSIKKKYDVVVLPESAFPIFLNLQPDIIKELKNLSKKITIVTGALHYKDMKFFNATYIFENGKVTIIDKHILVPFGEYIPFPIFQEEINKIFFNGASDYSTAKNFGIFKIKNYQFINAICYEATTKELYHLKPKYIIALSNMAWFMPSIAPVIQKLLIKTYATQYKKIVFHSLNGYKSYIIKG